MDRQKAYSDLVTKRKCCDVCKQSGLKNPSEYESLDHDQIGPWSCWQGDLNAEIMIVGQDWGDIEYFVNWQGLDQPTGNPTNSNLIKLLRCFDISIKNPREEQQHKIFLTNIILCLKSGGMQAPLNNEWLSNCSERFFCDLVKIIKPRIILALGKNVSETILKLYGVHYSKSEPFRTMVGQKPIKLSESMHLVPLYHCGAGSVNRNRNFDEQTKDWENAAEWFRTRNFAVEHQTLIHPDL